MSRLISNLAISLTLFLCVNDLLSSSPSAAQSGAKPVVIIKVDIDSAGQVHIIDSAGHETIPPKDKDQVSCESARIAEDRRTVGWLAEYANAANSYPLPLALVLYRDGKIIRQIGLGQSIWDWQFVNSVNRVAFWTGPTHGGFIPHFELHDVASGKLLAQWDGHLYQRHPAWVDGLEE